MLEKIDMLHGSTEYLFFQFKANFDKYNDYKFMCELARQHLGEKEEY